MILNIYTAWIAFMLGVISGAVLGLFFHKEEWLAGYGSWTRRMMRLGHISFFGIGLLNLSFALTVYALEIESGVFLSSVMLAAGAFFMPLICFVSAFRKPVRNFFFLPVLLVAGGIAAFLWRLVIS